MILKNVKIFESHIYPNLKNATLFLRVPLEGNEDVISFIHVQNVMGEVAGISPKMTPEFDLVDITIEKIEVNNAAPQPETKSA